MSLLVWLPLNGNLNNQGLSPAIFSLVNSSGGLSVASTGGKISQQCYQRTKKETADYITSNINFQLDGDISMCCWCKITDYGTNNSANGIITNHGHNTGGLGITMRYISANDYRMSINTGLRGDSSSNGDRTYMTYYSTTNIYNKWHHLCVTYKKSTKQCQMYIDGKLETIVGYGTSITIENNGTTARPFQIFSWSTDHASSPNYRPPCMLNDVRLYNHCLTGKEVAEIAKGLVAHYTFTNKVNPNLITTMKSGGRSSLVGKYGLDINFGANQDAYGWFNVNPALELGKTYTLSFDVSNFPTTGASSWDWQLWNNANYSFKVNKNGHYSFTFTPDASKLPSGYSLVEFLFDDGGRVGPADMVQFRNFKIELGEAETLFVENGEEDIDIEPDCSGYGRNLSFTDTCSLAQNSARYSKCIAIPDGKNKYGYCNTAFFPYEHATMSCWFKGTSGVAGFSNYHIPFSSGGGKYEISLEGATGKFRSGFYINGSRYCITTNSKNTCDGQWHMLTQTYDGATIRRYVDGEEIASSATSIVGTLGGGDQLLTIGHYGTDGNYGNQNTWMSDVRLYATALSSEAIKEMYKTSLQIDSEERVWCYELNDLLEDGESLNKNGVVGFADSGSGLPLYEMKTKVLPDGSYWARIFWHDVTTNKSWFASDAESTECLDKVNRYSRMNKASQYKTSEGWYEFMLTYPRLSTTEYNRWKQTSSPEASASTGYTPITTAWSQQAGGLRRTNGTATYNCDKVGSSTWYSAIGQKATWTDTQYIPGANGQSQTETELWVRIDNLHTVNNCQMYDNTLIANDFYEL